MERPNKEDLKEDLEEAIIHLDLNPSEENKNKALLEVGKVFNYIDHLEAVLKEEREFVKWVFEDKSVMISMYLHEWQHNYKYTESELREKFKQFKENK